MFEMYLEILKGSLCSVLYVSEHTVSVQPPCRAVRVLVRREPLPRVAVSPPTS